MAKRSPHGKSQISYEPVSGMQSREETGREGTGREETGRKESSREGAFRRLWLEEPLVEETPAKEQRTHAVPNKPPLHISDPFLSDKMSGKNLGGLVDMEDYRSVFEETWAEDGADSAPVRVKQRAPRRRQGGTRESRGPYGREPAPQPKVAERRPQPQMPERRAAAKETPAVPELRLDMPERRPQPKAPERRTAAKPKPSAPERKPAPEPRALKNEPELQPAPVHEPVQPKTPKPEPVQPRVSHSDPVAEWKPERVPSRKKPSGRRKEARVFTRGFQRGFWISLAVFAVLLLGALAALWTFLKNYESGLPDHAIAAVTEEIGTGDLTALHMETEDGRLLSDGSLYIDETAIAAYFRDKASAAPLSYIKVSAETHADETVYLVRSGEENLAKLYFTKAGKNGGWQESRTVLLSEALQVRTLTAQIPSSAKLLIGGTEIPRSFLTEEGAEIRLLSTLRKEGFLENPPTLDTYTVEGIFANAEPEMEKADGSRVPLSLTEEVYLGGFEAPEDFVEKQKKRVLSMFEPYAKYFSGDAEEGVLSEIMLDNSPAYESASSADVSWMQEHEDVRLSEERAENFQKYSDDCFSCDIHFVEDIYQNGEVVRSWDTNMTWVFVKDGAFYIADFMTRNQEEKG